MNEKVLWGFAPERKQLALEALLPTRVFKESVRKTAKYKRILSSIVEVGIIEPLVVFPQNGTGQYLLLDGHVRLEACRELGLTEAPCLISNVDDTFTYNNRINRLSAIQEHFMILKALKHGVAEERIARTLEVDVGAIREKRDLLVGICPEAVELLRDKAISANALAILRKVKAVRQVEMADLMACGNCFSSTYAKALLSRTPPSQLVDPPKPSENGPRPEEVARMEKEFATLEKEHKQARDHHGDNVLRLVVMVRFVSRLLDNTRVERFLSVNYPDILAEFKRIAEITKLEG